MRKAPSRYAVHAFVVIAALAVLAWPGNADTVFDNTSGVPTSGYIVGLNPNTGDSYLLSYSFTPTGNFQLDSVGAIVSVAGGGDPTLSYFLYADSGGEPGTVLESWTGVTVPSTATLETVAATSDIILAAGQQYWFGVTTDIPTDSAAWWINPAGDTSTGCDSINSGPFTCGTSATGAFQISGTPVPEPGALSMLCAGLLGCLGLAQRRLRRS